MTNLSKSTLVDLKHQLGNKIDDLRADIANYEDHVSTHRTQLTLLETNLRSKRELLAFSEWDFKHVKSALEAKE